MFRPVIIAALAAWPAAPLAAQAAPQDRTVQPDKAVSTAAEAEHGDQQIQAQTGQPPKRVRSITLTGNDKCPPSTANEVVVCSRINPNDQYRVPKELRRPPEIPAKNQSWVNRAETMDQVGRTAGGLPDTCSPVGSGGFTGCSQANARQWYLERQALKAQQKEGQSDTPPQD